MSAIERITKAVDGIADGGLAEVFAPDVVEAGKGIEDPRVTAITTGAANVIADYNRSRAEFGLYPLGNGDPRLKVFQLAGELRHLLETVKAK